MSLRHNLVAAITCALLIIGGGAMAWAIARSYAAELRSHSRAELTTVTLEAIRVTPREVSLEVRMETFIDVLLRVRRDGVQLDLSATFVGATPEHVADINYLASNKGKQIELWIEPRNPRSFSIRHEFPLYRAGPLVVCVGFALFGAWILYMIVKS